MLPEILIIGLILASVVLVILGILSIKQKFVRKYLLFTAILTALFFAVVLIANAQEKPSEKKDKQIPIAGQHEDMKKCMATIAADSTMRMQMMSKMMDHTKSDSSGMMQMCKMMMDNPEMHKMMMKMMQGKGMMEGGMMKHDMMRDSTKTMNKSDHKSHHQKE